MLIKKNRDYLIELNLKFDCNTNLKYFIIKFQINRRSFKNEVKIFIYCYFGDATKWLYGYCYGCTCCCS